VLRLPGTEPDPSRTVTFAAPSIWHVHAALAGYVLTLSCPDAAGIVAVASLLVELDCSIESSQQYGDPATERFFMRVQFAGSRPHRSGPARGRRRRAGGAFGMTTRCAASTGPPACS
jgi:formyltetrahydrofolate hydrolase